MAETNERNVSRKIVFLKFMLPQEFPLPKPIINYLIKHSNVEIVKKLQQTCRYFYSKLHYAIIDNLSIASYYYGVESILNFDVIIQDSHIDFFRNNLYLSQTLFISGNNLEKFYPKIIKCEIWKLRLLWCENFLITEFALLAKSGTLEHVEMSSAIYYPDKTIVPLEDILSYIPNVYHFECYACAITSSTMTKLFSVKRNVKFRALMLRLDSEFDDIHFLDKFLQETFVFPNPLSPGDRYLCLRGEENALRPLFELLKIRREHCFLDKCDYFWDLRVV